MKDHVYYEIINDLLTAIKKLQHIKPKIDFTWEDNPKCALQVAQVCGEAGKLIVAVGERALAEAMKSVESHITTNKARKEADNAS